MSLSIVILAAGKGSRMMSSIPKVLHKLAGKPLLSHVIETSMLLAPDTIVTVCGNGAEIVVPFVEDLNIQTVLQTEQKGTGHAVLQSKAFFEQSDTVLVLYGDVPLIGKNTLTKLLRSGNTTSLKVLTTELDNPTGYGRIVRNEKGEMISIREEKDADDMTKLITEVNTGIMAIPAQWLANAVDQLDNKNAQGEYYLTDLVSLAVNDGLTIDSVCCDDANEVAGVNTRQQLAQLERYFQLQQADKLMTAGVTLIDPARFDNRGELTIGKDSIIDINVIFAGINTLGNGVEIGANCTITNSTIGNGTVILPNSILENAVVGSICTIGPFARLRPGSHLSNQTKVGNFVEIKNANIGLGSKINHLSYIGDTDMGADVNIGAGTITCNYDGANKHRTVIGDRAFIGSDSQLVAPVIIEEGATIGAGSTIRKRAAAESLTLTKSIQKTISGWQRPIKKK
jgi:bifunctional UDP-N-acetylglucosamine pyrophosphorylase/glucosamine-1-phosphate N-acetyltransferase